MSSKDFGEMNPTRWMFEYRSLLLKRKKEIDVAKELMGLNFVPSSKDDDGNYIEGGPSWLPLAWWVNPEVFGNTLQELREKKELEDMESDLDKGTELGMGTTDIDLVGFTDEELAKMNEVAKKEVERQAKILGIKTEHEIKKEEQEMEKERKSGVRIRG